MSATGHLEIQRIGKSWGKLAALSGISLDIAAGRFVSLLGPSGCGKTTLLRLVAGSLAPDAGRLVLDGREITRLPTHRRNMGMVFQSFALFPHLSVAENVAFPLSVRGVGRAERERRVAEALAMVHLEAYAAASPRQLSGGQQQRVGLARAIVYRPTVLLLDEPLSNLDTALREEMRLEIGEVTHRLGITAIYVTHDQREALALSDEIAVMRAGRIVQVGTPTEIHQRPANAFVAGFLGYANAVPISVSGGVGRLADGTAIGLPADAPQGEAVAFLHAGDLVLHAAGSGAAGLACEVTEVAFMGERMEFALRHASGLRLKAASAIGATVFARGDAVVAELPAQRLVVVPP
jgi:putative spermidine/putrescine transport system ATP-binding protein